MRTVSTTSSPNLRRARQVITLMLIPALVVVPLLGGRTFTPPVQAQIGSCGGADRIFQGCPLGGPYETKLENQALDELLEFHQLPAADRSRLLGWQRNEVRALLYDKLLGLMKKTDARTPEEQTAYDAFASRVKQTRVAAAQFALDEYNRWQSNTCEYEPPTGFSYPGRQLCAAARLNPAVAGPIDPPKFEEFQAYGVARAEALYSQSAQRVTAGAARAVEFFGGVAGGAVAGGIALAIAVNLSQIAIAAIFPFAFGTAQLAAFSSPLAPLLIGGPSSTAAGLGSATVAIAGAVVIVVVAVVIGVLRGIDVISAADIPGKLQGKLTEVTNAPVPDLKQLIATEAGLQEVYAIFVLLTLPDFPATDPVPAAQAGDPQFRVGQDGSATTTTAATINFKSWDADNQSARLNGGWFINKYKEDNLDKERWALRIDYLNWRGEQWTAARTGAGFVHTKFDDPAPTFQSAEIKYLDSNGNKFTASLVLANLEIAVLPVVATRDGDLNRSAKTRPVAVVNSDGQAPNTLSISVNNGASATVTGVTISNLRIDAAGRVTADLAAECASSPPLSISESRTMWDRARPRRSWSDSPPSTMPSMKPEVPWPARCRPASLALLTKGSSARLFLSQPALSTKASPSPSPAGDCRPDSQSAPSKIALLMMLASVSATL